jgi:hypothetical protein
MEVIDEKNEGRKSRATVPVGVERTPYSKCTVIPFQRNLKGNSPGAIVFREFLLLLQK